LRTWLRATVGLTRIAVSTAVLYVVYTVGRLFFRRGYTWRNRMVRAWARSLSRSFHMHATVEGEPPHGSFLMVSNHVTFLDILLLALYVDVAFIAKSQVRKWPVIGMLAQSVGTIFIDRSSRRDAIRVGGVIDQSIRDGMSVLLFPEGKSGDGKDVLPFKPALLDGAARTGRPVHYAAIRYALDEVAWPGDEAFATLAWSLLKLPRIEVRLHFGGRVIAHDRKELAETLWGEVRLLVIGDAGS
jgi:1-acyl-sn-glycerol-3-phosphate acyltransferase